MLRLSPRHWLWMAVVTLCAGIVSAGALAQERASRSDQRAAARAEKKAAAKTEKKTPGKAPRKKTAKQVEKQLVDAEPVDIQSLAWAPEDAAFYCVMLRNREQIDALLQSNAWKKLMELPIVQQGFAKYKEEAGKAGTPPAQIEAARTNPQVQAILEVVGDMLGQEAFVIGGSDWADMIALVQEVGGVVQYQAPEARDDDEDEEDDEEEEEEEEDADEAGDEDEADDDDSEESEIGPERQQAARLMALLAEDPERIKVPATLIGFRVEDTARTEAQLNSLAGILSFLSMSVPQLSGRFNQQEVGDYRYWVLSLEGSTIPWEEQLPVEEMKEIEQEEGQAQAIIDRLKESKISVALGMRDNFLLVSIGESTEPLASLGDRRSLAARPELAPLAKFAEERLTGVSYFSEEIATRLSNTEGQLDNFVAAIEQGLAQSELDEELQEELVADAEDIMSELKERIPEQGAMSAFSFLTDAGAESFTYHWNGNPSMDGSERLGLLAHVGEKPLLAVIGRGAASQEDYEWMTTVVDRVRKNLDRTVTAELNRQGKAEDLDKYREISAKVWPLLERLDQANREHLLPATKGGECGLVIDAQLRTKQLAGEIPATEEPMPIPEPAIVFSHNDAQAIQQASEEYWAVMNDVVDVIRDADPEAIPADYEIPEPEMSQADGATLYTFALPEEWQVDEQIAPTWAIGEEVAVLAASPSHAKRVLASASPISAGVLEDADKPRAMAAIFDWAGTIDAARPWIDLAARKAASDKGADEEEVASQVNTVLDVLKSFRTITVEGYIENDVYVEHSLVEIRDIEE